MKKKIIKLGDFENICSKFVISDPCYELGVFCQGTLENVKRGIWEAYVETSDEGD